MGLGQIREAEAGPVVASHWGEGGGEEAAVVVAHRYAPRLVVVVVLMLEAALEALDIRRGQTAFEAGDAGALEFDAAPRRPDDSTRHGCPSYEPCQLFAGLN